MLTQRQKRLLVLLANDSGWLTSAQLADRLAISGKLVKQEVAAIRAQLGQACAIQSSTRRGYHLVHVDATVRDELSEHLNVHAGHHSITHRYRLVFLCLALSAEPLPLGRMAQRLYCSRAMVEQQVETLRYRLRRLPHMVLEVSHAHGVFLRAEEWARRYEVSKWLRDDCVAAFISDARERAGFCRDMRVAERHAAAVLRAPIREGRLSGGDAARIARWCALSRWRTLNGFSLDGANDDGGLLPPAGAEAGETARALAASIGDELAYRFEDEEVRALAQLIGDCLVPCYASDTGRRCVARLAEQVGEALGACVAEERARELAGRAELVRYRLGVRRFQLNYHASETVAAYPLAYHLAATFLEREGFTEVSKAEAAFLALDVEQLVRAAAPPAPLYTDESLPVADAARRALETCGAGPLRIEVHPCWEDAGALPLMFTTDPGFAAEHPDALLVPLFPRERDVRGLAAQLAERLEARRASVRARLVHEAPSLSVPDGARAMTAFDTYVAVCREEGESFIECATTPKGFKRDGKRYRRLAVVHWGTRGVDALTLFDVLSAVLSEGAGDVR